MLRDTTEIALVGGDGCNVILDDQTVLLFNVPSGTEKTYKLINDKYTLVSTTEYTEPDDRQQYTCVEDTTIQNLPSRYDFMAPYLNVMAIAVALILFFLAFRLIVYPFFRKRV